MRTSDSQRLTSKKASNSKSILNKKYKNLLQRGSKKRSLDLKKKEKRHYNFQKLTNENISRNTSLVLKKKSRKSNKQGTRPFNKRKRTFTGRVLENYGNKTHGFNEFNGTSHEKINSKSFLKENQKSHENVRSNSGCDFFVKKRKSKVEKILKNLQKKGRISCKENSSEQSLRTRNKSFSFRMRKSVSLTGNQNLFNEHFISREQPEEQSRSKRTVGKNNTSRHLKSSSMSQLGVTKTPSVLLESNDTNQAPLDSKRTPLDNYFKIYLTQCKSIKFTSPAGEHEDKVRDSSTVQEHNAKNSEFIQNLKRYLSTERMDFKEENLKQQIEEANLILNQQDADFTLEGETFEDMALKTKRKFNKEPEKKLSLSPEPSKVKDEPYNRFEFSAKVLGNLDQRRRQKFFDKENGMKYLKQWKEKKVKQERHVEREVTKKKQHPSMDKFSKTLGPKQKKRLKNYKSGLRKKRKSFINQKKKRYGSFRRNVSREKSFDSLNMSVPRRRPNSSMKSSNSRISGSYTRKKSRGKRKMKIHTFDSSLMTKEIKELTDELRKLKFTKEKISEFNDIFLPYLDFTFNLEIKNKRLQHELKEAQEKQKVAEKKLSEVQTGAETKMAEFKKQFDLKFEAERNLRKNLEKNLSESENNLKELKQQNLILNDVLKGICQERENEEKPSIDTKTSFKVESLKDSIPDYNEGRNRRRDSVRRSGEFNRSRCSLSVPKLDNNDVIMELRYELKIAHEEIQDFKVKPKLFNKILEFFES